MAGYDFVKMQKKLSKYLDESRFIHTQGVMYLSAALAMAHGYDMNDARCAGLLHDSAKCIPNKKKLRMCEQHRIPVSDFERSHPFLLHAKLGAYVAKAKYGVTDPEILSSITWHTTGRPDMSILEKIIYIADYIEPGRDKAPRLTEIRHLAFKDLDECMYEILKDSVEYLGGNPKEMDDMSLKAYAYYKELHEERMAQRAAEEEAAADDEV